jgi:hypothetical protein
MRRLAASRPYGRSARHTAALAPDEKQGRIDPDATIRAFRKFSNNCLRITA